MIGSLGRFAKLPLPDQAATIEALTTVATARLLVATLPHSRLSRWLQPSLRQPPLDGKVRNSHPDTVVERICTAVTRASRRIPGSTCLVQAIAGWWMLKYRGIDARICIGVDKAESEFSAHAWLAIGDTIVLGGADAAVRFVVLEPK